MFRNIANSLVSFPTQWHLRRNSRSMEELTKEAEAKLQMLLYTNGKTLGIVEKGNRGAAVRYLDNLQAIVKEVDGPKLRVEQTMFEAGKSAEDVESWSRSIVEPIAEADEEVLRLEKWLLETNE